MSKMRVNIQSLVGIFIGSVLLVVTYVRVIKDPTQANILEQSKSLMRQLQKVAASYSMSSHHSVCTKEIHHVAFIKVHKAGSSTIANILFRYGIARHLTFMMPARDVTVSLHLSQPWTNILPLPDGITHYDILSNHAVYEKSEIQRLFPQDTVILAVLRKPMGHLESSMYYYYSQRYKGEEDKVGAYLKHPELLGVGDRYVNNSMAYELGVPRQQFYNETFVRLHAEKIVTEIDFVMILERLDESLVLLKRRLCWQLKDIIYIIRNVNSKKPHIKRSEAETGRLKQLMPAHFILYDFFYQKLEEEILSSPGLEEEVSHFKKLLIQVSDFCLDETESSESMEFPSSEWNDVFVIPRKNCRVFKFNGLEILQYARVYQYGQNWREFQPASS